MNSIDLKTKMQLTASVCIGCTANNMAAAKLANSGKSMAHILIVINVVSSMMNFEES